MAHYKRGKCRYQAPYTMTSDTTRRSELGLKPVRDNWSRLDWLHPYYFNLYSRCPKWHRIIFHHRKRRQAERALERAAVMDRHDHDDVAWPLRKKPVLYYW
jgi:hypothetical protein